MHLVDQYCMILSIRTQSCWFVQTAGFDCSGKLVNSQKRRASQVSYCCTLRTLSVVILEWWHWQTQEHQMKSKTAHSRT